MTNKSNHSRGQRTRWATRLLGAALALLVLVGLAAPASAAPEDPTPDGGGLNPAIELVNPAVNTGMAVSYDVSPVCHETGGGVAVAVTNRSHEPQTVHGMAATQPLAEATTEQFEMYVEAGSTVRYVVGSWPNGSYVGVTLRHQGVLSNHDVTVNCGTPEPSASAYPMCMWPGGRHIFVDLGNTGTADAQFTVGHLLLGDDQVLLSTQTVVPNQVETLQIPVASNGTYVVKVGLLGSTETVLDETIHIDCEPIDDTVEPTPTRLPATHHGTEGEPSQTGTDAESASTPGPSVDAARGHEDPSNGRVVPLETADSTDEDTNPLGSTLAIAVLAAVEQVVTVVRGLVSTVLQAFGHS